MKKREFLTTALASLIAINILGGCGSNNTAIDSSKSDVIEETIDEQEPQVDIIELPLDENDEKFRNSLLSMKEKDNNIITLIKCNAKVTTIKPSYDTESNTYYLPSSDINGTYILVGSLGYKVDIEYTYQYPATKEELEDGTIVYYAPFGGTLEGTQVIIRKTIPLNGEDIRSFLEEYGYIENKNAKLTKSF